MNSKNKVSSKIEIIACKIYPHVSDFILELGCLCCETCKVKDFLINVLASIWFQFK